MSNANFSSKICEREAHQLHSVCSSWLKQILENPLRKFTKGTVPPGYFFFKLKKIMFSKLALFP
jgi:hypothetical protein